jgi:hypothetical protein
MWMKTRPAADPAKVGSGGWPKPNNGWDLPNVPTPPQCQPSPRAAQLQRYATLVPLLDLT